LTGGIDNRRQGRPRLRESHLGCSLQSVAIESIRGRQANEALGLGDRGARRATWEKRQAVSNSTPGGASFTTILWSVYQSFQKDRILAVSAGIAFYGLLAIFPALAALLSIYDLFADVHAVQRHLAALEGVLPGGAIEIIGEQIKRIASATNSNLGLAFFVGLAVSLWSANAGMRALIDGLNIAYAKPEKRGFIKLALVSLGFTAGAILAVSAALSLIVALPAILNFIGLGGAAEALFTYGRWPALLLIFILGLAVLYRYGASPHGARWRWITPGSAIAAMIWLAASVGFSYYAAHFGSFNKTYGSLGAAVGFMTWMWISIIVILTGAELNGNLEALEKPLQLISTAIARA
jgi:membrane protein